MNSYLDSIHYKFGYQLYCLLLNENHSNIIIYGVKYIGKTNLIQLLIKTISNAECNHISNKDLTYSIYGNYYYFNLINIGDKKVLINHIKDIVRSKNHFLGKKHTIVFDHFECLNSYFQDLLKVIIEKASITTHFIIITNNFTNVNTAILSRCISIRIPTPTKYDKFFHIKGILDKKKIEYNEELLLIKCNDTIEKIMINTVYNDNINNINNMISYKVIELFFDPQLNIKKVKDYAYDINQLDILKDFIKNIINIILKVYKNINKELLIKETARYEHIINKSYRDIIYLESFIIRLYKIVNGL